MDHVNSGTVLGGSALLASGFVYWKLSQKIAELEAHNLMLKQHHAEVGKEVKRLKQEIQQMKVAMNKLYTTTMSTGIKPAVLKEKSVKSKGKQSRLPPPESSEESSDESSEEQGSEDDLDTLVP